MRQLWGYGLQSHFVHPSPININFKFHGTLEHELKFGFLSLSQDARVFLTYDPSWAKRVLEAKSRF